MLSSTKILAEGENKPFCRIPVTLLTYQGPEFIEISKLTRNTPKHFRLVLLSIQQPEIINIEKLYSLIFRNVFN